MNCPAFLTSFFLYRYLTNDHLAKKPDLMGPHQFAQIAIYRPRQNPGHKTKTGQAVLVAKSNFYYKNATTRYIDFDLIRKKIT
jgi:hypothetical protein